MDTIETLEERLKESEVLLEQKQDQLKSKLSEKDEKKPKLSKDDERKLLKEIESVKRKGERLSGEILLRGLIYSKAGLNGNNSYDAELDAMSKFANIFRKKSFWSGKIPRLTREGIKSRLNDAGYIQNGNADILVDAAILLDYPSLGQKGKDRLYQVSSGYGNELKYQMLPFASAEKIDSDDHDEFGILGVAKPENKKLKFFRPVGASASKMGMLGKFWGAFFSK